MRRIVVVSNRLPHIPTPGPQQDRHIPVGGLASALRGALRSAPGSLWFGSESMPATEGQRTFVKLDGTQLVGIALTQRESAEYYRGFCNQALWPLFHGFLGRVRLDQGEEACYWKVSERFARELMPLLRPFDLVWVHDYHFLCFGYHLRRLGWRGAIGFFLHVPFPPYDLWSALPQPRGFLEAMLEYDLVGFQTRTNLDNYTYCCRRELGARYDGVRITAGERRQRAGVYPIGIEPEVFQPTDDGAESSRRHGELSRVVRGRRLILGVDRLDYTKGIPERLEGFEALMHRHPGLRKRVSFVQIASPSRSRIPGYLEQKQRVDEMVGRINGELADHDWVPIRYLYRSYPQEVLAGFYREADVGLVTPLRDGMNLIAKEFVAAQHPESPGVLVLSRLAGAAEELHEAVLVNPYLPSDMAAGIARALAMPLGKRRELHRALLAKVMKGTAGAWSNRFLDHLAHEVDARWAEEAWSREETRAVPGRRQAPAQRIRRRKPPRAHGGA